MLSDAFKNAVFSPTLLVVLEKERGVPSTQKTTAEHGQNFTLLHFIKTPAGEKDGGGFLSCFVEQA